MIALILLTTIVPHFDHPCHVCKDSKLRIGASNLNLHLNSPDIRICGEEKNECNEARLQSLTNRLRQSRNFRATLCDKKRSFFYFASILTEGDGGEWNDNKIVLSLLNLKAISHKFLSPFTMLERKQATGSAEKHNISLGEEVLGTLSVGATCYY